MNQMERQQTLDFIASNNLGEPGRYRYSRHCTQPTLYSSSYAAMVLDLLNAWDGVDKAAWLAYLQSFQEDDGLFKDPVIWNYGWYEGDPFWCGRTHLTTHVLPAMLALGGVAEKEMTFLNPWKDPDWLAGWMAEQDWGPGVDTTGNIVMNAAVLLQYARDFHHDAAAGRAVEQILDWLDTNHVDPETGLWGGLDLSDPKQLSNSVQGAYHWWVAYFYDKRPLPHWEKAMENILRTRNPLNGFGWGVHNPEDPYQSSACEDIDSLDPLCRLWMSGATRDPRVREAIEAGRERVASNRMADGGLCFYRDREFEYGHPQLYGGKNEGAMFPTWFRTLTLCLCDAALGTDTTLNFRRCPGYQF